MARSVVMTRGEEEIVFYYELGEAMASWAAIESVLREIVCCCFEPGEESITINSVSVGFLSIETFRAKMDFAEGLLKRRFPHRRAEWEGLVKKGRDLSALRNRLAHWPVLTYEANSPGRRFLLVPWVFKEGKKAKPPKRPLAPKGSLSMRDIRKFRIEFVCYAIALKNFACRLSGIQEVHEKSHEIPTNPPPLATMRKYVLHQLARLLQDK